MDPSLEEKRKTYLADKLKAARSEKGLSREILAQIAGVSFETLKKIEQKSTKSPGFFLVADLAQALDLEINDLIYSDQEGEE